MIDGLPLLVFTFGVGRSGAWKISEKPAAAGAALTSGSEATSLGSASFFLDFFSGAATSATASTS